MTTAQLLPPSLPEHDLMEISLFPMTVTERDERVAALIGRLIVNTCLAMSDPARVRAPAPAGARGARRQADARRGGAPPKLRVSGGGSPLARSPASEASATGSRYQGQVEQSLTHPCTEGVGVDR
ncbi:hypothetical protein [Polyangium mundeleinium]|uniref:Uncharacterized protein n=1 Tax=Polyangium mundeleinium TaxID=2995306 RepID=A0ABT5EUC4_9BACT|nr:hypothetical protein [Polyangium mundeleinium]MDC0745429.1 hypothetical protein [Polyangium mundeleinium]